MDPPHRFGPTENEFNDTQTHKKRLKPDETCRFSSSEPYFKSKRRKR